MIAETLEYRITADMASDVGRLLHLETYDSDIATEYESIGQYSEVLAGNAVAYPIPIDAGDILVVKASGPVLVSLDSGARELEHVTFLVIDFAFTDLSIGVNPSSPDTKVQVLSLGL